MNQGQGINGNSFAIVLEYQSLSIGLHCSTYVDRARDKILKALLKIDGKKISYYCVKMDFLMVWRFPKKIIYNIAIH